MAARMNRLLTTGKTHQSFRSAAKLLEINESTVRYHAEKKGINCYKKRKRNLIPKTQKEMRRYCCMKFRKTYRKSDVADFLFVDECYVTVKKHFNVQNERCYGKSFDLIPDYKKFRELPKTPLSAMIFGAVSREGRSRLVVLKSGFRLNQYTYKDKCLIPLQKRLPYKLNAATAIFYQDKAPCHRAGSVQKHLKKNFPRYVPHELMPPNSPDLSPLDYCVWNELKERLNKHGLISSFNKLKKILKKEWEAIPQAVIQVSVDS